MAGLAYLNQVDDLSPDQLKELHPFLSVFSRLSQQVVKDGDPNGHGQLVVELEKLFPAQLGELGFRLSFQSKDAASMVAEAVAAGKLQALIDRAQKMAPGLSFKF